MLNDSKANKIFMLVLVLIVALFSTIRYTGNKTDMTSRTEQTFDLKTSDALEITTVSNDISVEIDPKAKRASASVGGGKTAKLSVERNGSTVEIKVSPIKKSFFSFSIPNTSRLVVTLPQNYLESLSITTVSADIDIMRDLEVEKLAAKTISGDIDALNLKAKDSVSLASTSGQISCYSVDSKRKASIATTSGDIDINEILGSDIEIHSISANIETAVTVQPGGNLKATSTSGNIELSLKGIENLKLSANTTSGGIRVRDAEQAGKSYTETTGDGSTQVFAKTTSGNIEISY
jgi:DUF4097 and DUF4098 domain-containing protein YvlB